MVVAMSVIMGVIEIALCIVVMLELAIMCMLMNRLFCCRLCHFMRMMVVFMAMVMMVTFMVVVMLMGMMTVFMVMSMMVIFIMIVMMLMPLQINIHTLLFFPVDRHFHMRPGDPTLY